MGPDRASMSLRRALLAIALACGFAGALPGLAYAAYSWQSGPLVESQDSNCVTNGSEQEAGSWLSYYINPQAPPQTGQTYYVAIDLDGIGDPCAGAYADVELALPSGTTPAVTASDPVICYLKSPTSSSYKRDTQDCPQNLQTSTYGYSLDPVHANPPFWPVPRGGDIEIQVPVASSQAGDLQLEGVVQLADGQSDPILTPKLQMVVDTSGAQSVQGSNDQIGVYYNSPSLTSNTQTPPTTGPTTVDYVAGVENYSNPGNVIAELNYADSSGDCNAPGTNVVTTSSTPLQYPNTGLSGNFHGLFPDVAYCWRLVATVTSGAEAGTYYGNWEYFITNGDYVSGAGPGEPAAANPPAVQQCDANAANGDGCGYSGCSTSTCTQSGTLSGSTQTLSLSLPGSGSGTVTGPAGFSCKSTCSGTFASGSTVTLTAAVASGSAFLGWGGACSGKGTCTVTMSSAQSVTANFAAVITEQNPTLLVSLAGAGSGTVSSPGGISCPTTCSHSYRRGTSDTLTATAAPGSTFEGWNGGGCSGTGTCKVTMIGNKSVTAEFAVTAPDTETLTVSVTGTGSGKVSSPGGIFCPTACVHTYTAGAGDTLSAVPAKGSRFTGWSGGGCSGTGTCKVTMSADRSVNASFASTIIVPPPGKPKCTITPSGSKVALRIAKERHHKAKILSGSVTIDAKCSQAVSASLTGKLTEKEKKKHKTFSLAARGAVAANVVTRLTVKLPVSALKALSGGAKESATFAMSVRNANGVSRATTRIARLRR